jgi:hypothetical protein
LTASPERRDSIDKGRSDGLSPVEVIEECFLKKGKRRIPAGIIAVQGFRRFGQLRDSLLGILL